MRIRARHILFCLRRGEDDHWYGFEIIIFFDRFQDVDPINLWKAQVKQDDMWARSCVVCIFGAAKEKIERRLTIQEMPHFVGDAMFFE